MRSARITWYETMNVLKQPFYWFMAVGAVCWIVAGAVVGGNKWAAAAALLYLGLLILNIGLISMLLFTVNTAIEKFEADRREEGDWT